MIIKKGNKVKILTGKDRNKEGEIIELDRSKHRAKVKGLNLVKKHNLTEIEDDNLLEELIIGVMGKNEKMILEYKSGKEKALNALVGQVMKISKGRANAQSVKNKIIDAIGKI